MADGIVRRWPSSRAGGRAGCAPPPAAYGYYSYPPPSLYGYYAYPPTGSYYYSAPRFSIGLRF